MPRLADYRKQWAAQNPGPQSEEYQREMAVQRAENQLRSEGTAHIEGERERIFGMADRVSTSSANVQKAAREITKACGSRIVDVDKVADELDELERQCRADRAMISRIEEQHAWNENRAADPIGVGEALYDKYTFLVHPLDVAAPPPFRPAGT
ncbi:hypothetical protein WCD74_11670 [Actinomycetospora sp. OC33-EN08]|uniref:Uncharacterized protein n=1 Tax=Actinomycetospora aurantiaca TaxID=3129233 RepID=A0ABU8MMA9_9PSEU